MLRQGLPGIRPRTTARPLCACPHPCDQRRRRRHAQEEDRIIVGEVNTLKKLLADRTMTGKRLREYLVRLIYVEMLGHDASFGYMKAVEVRASGGDATRLNTIPHCAPRPNAPPHAVTSHRPAATATVAAVRVVESA